MTRKGQQQDPPLHLDLDFGEALERFARTDPAQVRESIERGKKKKPPGTAVLDGQATPDGRRRTKSKR